MRVAVACVLCLALTSVSAAYWSIDLESKTLKNGNQLQDIIYYSHSGYKTGEIFFDQRTIFDLTTHENFALSTTCTDTSCLTDNTVKVNCANPCSPRIDSSTYNSGIDKIVLASGRVEILDSNRGEDIINIDEQELKKIPILFNAKFSNNLDSDFIPGFVRSAYGLSYVDSDLHPNKKNENNNFIKQVASAKPEVSKQQVSFYFGKQIERVMFGDVEKYFAKGEFETFRNTEIKKPAQWGFPTATATAATASAVDGLNLWGLDLSGITVSSQQVLDGQKKITTFFDSTSSFIYVHKTILDLLVSKVNGNGSDYCQDQNDGSVLCDCRQEAKFPDITFTFKNLLQKDGVSKQYNLKPAQYLIELDYITQGKQCLFAFRGPMKFGPTNAQTEKPQVVSTDSSQYYIWFGTSFLSAFYVAFDQTNQQIHIAEAYQASVSDLHLNETFHYTVIVLGLVLFLGACWVLLSILKKVQTITVPQRPAQSYSLQSPVQIAPVAQYGFMPQQPLYRQY